MPADGTICVNSQGARYIARAFEEEEQGFSTKEILTVIARNLGLSPIGKKGETTIYNPLRHEDTVGGLLPGQAVLKVAPRQTQKKSKQPAKKAAAIRV
jgi:hypothetical protein